MRSGCDVSRAARASAAEPRTDSTSWARSLARHRHTAAACSLIDAVSTPDQYLHSHMDTLSNRRRVHAGPAPRATWTHCLIISGCDLTAVHKIILQKHDTSLVCHAKIYTDTYTQPFNDRLSGTTGWAGTGRNVDPLTPVHIQK